MGEHNDILQGLRILAVEDTLLVANEIEFLVKSLGCHVFGPVPSVAEALALIEQHEIDGALLDVNLGREDVFPVAAQLAERGVPFIFMTGYDACQLEPGYRQCACLQKPFTKVELKQIMEDVFGQHAGLSGR